MRNAIIPGSHSFRAKFEGRLNAEVVFYLEIGAAAPMVLSLSVTGDQSSQQLELDVDSTFNEMSTGLDEPLTFNRESSANAILLFNYLTPLQRLYMALRSSVSQLFRTCRS